MRFLPWQDGGVVILLGNFPLEGLLLFAGREVLKGPNIFNRPGAKISPVLPISKQDFNEMLGRLQSQSNLVVRKDPAKFIIQKLADEGSASPFWARLFMQILRLADIVFPSGAKRDEFYRALEFLITQLRGSRSAAQEISQIWSDHTRKISQGEIVRVENSVVHISENIDAELRKQTESLAGWEVGLQGTEKGQLEVWFGRLLLGHLNPLQTSFLRTEITESKLLCHGDLKT